MAGNSNQAEHKQDSTSAAKERPRLKDRRSLAIPLVTGGILIVALCAYYFVYVRERREYLINRDFRALAVLGNQLQRSITVHSTVLQMFANQRDQVRPSEHKRTKQSLDKFLRTQGDQESHEDRTQYLHFLAPDFNLTEVTDAEEHPALTVSRRNGAWDIELATSTANASALKQAHTTYIGDVKISDLVKPFVTSLPFDDILLASQTGAIVYEKSLTGPQFTTLGALLGNETGSESARKQSNGSESSKDDSSASPQQSEWEQVQLNSDRVWRTRSLHLTELTLAGSKYTVFLQPVVVDYGANGTAANGKPREWVLCGLTKSNSLQWEALAISYTIIIWLVAGFLIVCLSAPMLKIFLLNQWEHLKARELAIVGLFLILLSCVCTLSGMQAVYYHLIAERTDESLNQLALKFAGNVHTEVRQMRDQLVQLCKSNELAADLKTAGQTEVIRRLSRDPSRDMPPYGRTPETKLFVYPYFDNVFWTDSDGHQIVKWGTSSYVTPMIDVSQLVLFKRLSDPEQHSLMYVDGMGPPFVMDSVTPPNKLDYLAVLGTRTCSCNPALCAASSGIGPDESKGYAFIAARPFSMIRPLLPYGYGFALVDRSGSVLFHSDQTQNTLENFVQESDGDRQLYAAMFGHSNDRCMNVTYMGKPYRARVVPIDGLAQAPWSLVVFRDQTFVRTLNLQTTAMAATLFLMMLAVPVALVIIWRGTCRPKFVAEWLWPHRGRTFTYAYQSGIYVLLTIILLVIASASSSEETLVACAAVPYTAFAFTFWAMRLFPSCVQEDCRPKRSEIVVASVVSIIAAVAFVWVLRSEWPYLNTLFWLLPVWLVALIPLLEKPRTGMMLAFQRHFGGNGSASDAEQFSRSYRTYYALSASLLLLLVGVLTPLLLFRDARKVEARLFIKESQLHLAGAAEQQQALLQSQCDSEQRSLPECREAEVAGQETASESAGCASSRQPWNRNCLKPLYKDSSGSDFKQHSTDIYTEFYAPWFQHLVYALHHDYNQPAAEMLGVIADRGMPKAGDLRRGGSDPGSLPEWAWNETDSKISLRKHGSEPTRYLGPNDMDLLLSNRVQAHTGRDTAVAIAVVGVVMFFMGGLFWALARRVFLFHVTPNRITGRRQAAEALRAGKNIIVLVPSASQWKPDCPSWPLDLKQIAQGGKWGEDFDLSAVPLHKLIEVRYTTNGESQSNAPDRKLSLEELEAQAKAENQRVIFLERLIARPGTQVAVVIVVGASTVEYAKKFPAFEVVDLREEPLLWQQAYSGPAKDLLWKECSPLAVLWPLGAQLAKDLSIDNSSQSDQTYTEANIAVEVLEKAEPYYRMIWDECTPVQKFVLSQLATDGIPNPANERIVQQFVRRGLIVKDPQFRIMNESFRRFLAAAPTQHLKTAWMRESRKTGWGKAHGAFFTVMLVVGAFLLTTQNDLWQSSAAYVTTALGALGTLAKLFNTIRGGAITSSDHES